MLPLFPPELLDFIADHSSNDPTTLKTCCLLSKSWVSRTRRYLFARIEFDSRESDGHHLESWMKIFPDPLNSPTRHTRSLTISGITAVTAATTHGHPWVRSFRSLVELSVETLDWFGGDMEISLVQLHGLSPTLKSLHVDRSSLLLFEIFNLVCSFPLLEDLSLRSIFPQYGRDHDPMGVHETSPKLTGSLALKWEICSVAPRLLALPGGLHFTKITVDCCKMSIELAKKLVSRCSGTLESLCLDVSLIPATPSASPFDLSKAAKLTDVELLWRRPDIQWITTLLQTIKSSNLRRITITMDEFAAFVHPVDEAILRKWQDLDHLLVQLWTSRSILPKIRYERRDRGDDMGELAPTLLPGLTSRGAVSAVE